MDENLFDRITQTLASRAPRRATLRATAAAALASISSGIALDTAGAKKNRKRCRKRLKTCGGQKKCCNGYGPIACQTLQEETKPQCDDLSGRRCCGLDGASCDLDLRDCDCCGRGFCREVEAGVFRCEDDPT